VVAPGLRTGHPFHPFSEGFLPRRRRSAPAARLRHSWVRGIGLHFRPGTAPDPV
jgi:hypothetical protein